MKKLFVFILAGIVCLSCFTSLADAQQFQKASKFKKIKMLVVKKPNGGESLNIGFTTKIEWQAAGLENKLKITLWRNGSSLGTIMNDVDPAMGSIQWKIGQYQGGVAAQGGGYKIKIKEKGTSIADMSNGPFTLNKLIIGTKVPDLKLGSGKIDIVKPSASSFWDEGEKHNIVWKNTFTKNRKTKIDLYNYNGKKFVMNIATVKLNNPGSTSSYLWTIPKKGPAKFMIKISTPDGSSGMSKMFTIRINSQVKKYKIYATTMNKYKYYWWKGDKDSFSVGYEPKEDPGPGKMRLGFENYWTSQYGGQYYGFCYRSFLGFNVSQFKGKGLILKATLHYNVFMGQNCGIKIYSVNKGWSNPFAVDVDAISSNLTSTVIQWVNTPSSNHGLMLTGTNEGVLQKKVQKNNTKCVSFSDDVYLEVEILEKK